MTKKKNQQTRASAQNHVVPKKNPLSGVLKKMKITTYNDGSARLVGSELIGQVNPDSTTAQNEILFQVFLGFQSQPAQAVNPDYFALDKLPSIGGSSSPSRLAYLAQAFEKFKFTSLKMEVVPATSLQTSGGYFHSFLTDPLDVGVGGDNSDNIVQALTREGAAMGAFYETTESRLPIDRSAHYFVNDRDADHQGPNPVGTSESTQMRLTYPGVYRLAASSSTNVGQTATLFIVMHYDVTLMNPTIPTGESGDGGGVGVSQKSQLVLAYRPTETAPQSVAPNEAVTLIPSSGTEGSLNLDPGAANNGTFKVSTQLDANGNPEIVPWWNYTSNTFAEPGEYAVNVVLPGLTNMATGNVGSGGPFNMQINDTSTYSASRTARLLLNTFIGDSLGKARDGLGSGIGNSSSPSVGQVGALVAGLYRMIAAPGDRFNFFLNASSTLGTPLSNTAFVLPVGTIITLSKLLTGNLSSLEKRRRSIVVKQDAWSLPEWYDTFGGVTTSCGCQAYATLLSAVNSDHHPFDDLDAPGWRDAIKEAMIDEVEEKRLIRSVSTWDYLYSQLETLQSARSSEAVLVPRPTTFKPSK